MQVCNSLQTDNHASTPPLKQAIFILQAMHQKNMLSRMHPQMQVGFRQLTHYAVIK